MRAKFFLAGNPMIGEVGATGGIISNYHLIRAVAKMMPTELLAFGEGSATKPVESDGFTVRYLAAPRLRRGLAFFGWMDQVERVGLKGFPEIDRQDIVFLSTNTLAAANSFRARGAITVGIVRAYENFGPYAPGDSVRGRLRGLRNEVALGWSSKSSMSSLDFCIVNSQYMATQVAKRFRLANPPCVLYPPLDIPLRVDRRTDRSLNVGFVNRSSGKNPALVIELARKLPKFTFKVFGPPIAGELSPNIICLGWETDRERLFDAAQTWIVPSVWNEPFGRVAIEAMARGGRVIVSGMGGLPEAVGSFGRTIRGFSVREWAEAIVQAQVQDTHSSEAHVAHLDQFSQRTHDDRVACLLSEFTVQKS